MIGLLMKTYSGYLFILFEKEGMNFEINLNEDY
jgi:hypothetical protein